jgi:Sortase domain
MRWGALPVALGLALVCLVVPRASAAAAPPNPSDPCARQGRDGCGTTGVGFYRSQRYGVRWFGDYRGAVPGEAHTFCIDLRFWYASASYRYREQSGRALLNKDGAAVSVEKQRRMAYAIWEFGRSASPSRQAALMLYVHALMGDARPGEVDPAGLGPSVASTYRAIAVAARRYHGPYRIQTRLAGKLTVGRPATATVRLLSATGLALPNAKLALTAQGANGITRHVRADSAGMARIAFTPTAVDVRLRVAGGRVASSSPRIFVPTSGASVANGQRLAAPTSVRVAATVPLQARPAVATEASSEVVRPGSRIFDRIRVRGLGRASARIQVELFGPFSRRAAIRCDRKPYWTGRVEVGGSGPARSPSVVVAKAGFYTFRERLVGQPSLPATTTDCAVTTETVLSAPSVVAGRGDTYAETLVRGGGASTPTEVRIPSLGVRARVEPAAIDLRHGALGIPADISVAGWWRDGASPGGRSGAILIAGHVDSARGGAGAFFKLQSARAGNRVQLVTAGRRAYAYRVISVRSYPKSALPTSVYSVRGAPRLVLVTCGGPFDAETGHYRDNVVVTAVPV